MFFLARFYALCRQPKFGGAALALSGLAISTAAWLALAANPMTALAADQCANLTGDDRRQCVHAQVVAQTEANRAAAASAKSSRDAQAAQREASNNGKPVFSSGPSPTRTYGNKLRFADPRSIWKQSDAEGDRTNQQMAIDWVNRNDPGYVALRSAIEKEFPLWARAHLPSEGSVQYVLKPGRFAGELFIFFGHGDIQAQLVEGELCLGNALTLYKACDDIPSSMADADRLHAELLAQDARDVQEAAQEKQEAAAVIAGSATRRPGSPLNAVDEACMKTFTETYQESVEGECTAGHATQLDNGAAGEYVCTAHASQIVTRTRSYEKNVCNRTISFKDQCGSTIFQSNVVKPGERFDRKFSYPCGRVY